MMINDVYRALARRTREEFEEGCGRESASARVVIVGGGGELLVQVIVVIVVVCLGMGVNDGGIVR
jgi:hypothetical protein